MKTPKMIRLEQEEIDLIQEYADSLEISFSSAARILLKQGLNKLKAAKCLSDKDQLTDAV